MGQTRTAAQPGKNTGIAYENLVQSIFQEIVNQYSVKTITVQRRVPMQGFKTKANYVIDVYWEYILGGIVYRTIVQAKDWKSKVKQEQVLALIGVLDDIPGQPRGVLVTRTGFQAGAKKVAQANGIKLFLLDQRKRGPNSQITEFSWLIYRYDPPTQMMNVTSFRPDFDLRLEFARDSLPSFTEKPLPRDLQLFDEKGVRIGTVGDVVSGFTTSMQKSGARDGSFTREFKEATFLKKPDEGRRYRLNTVKADVRIIEEPLPSFPLLPSGIVEFILEDLEAGTSRTYRRKK
jgi:hypothetical protein